MADVVGCLTLGLLLQHSLLHRHPSSGEHVLQVSTLLPWRAASVSLARKPVEVL